MGPWPRRAVAVKLLLDEMLSPLAATELRRRGHDVVAVKATPALVGQPDEEVLRWAREHGRAVVTNNVGDFRRLHATAVTPGGGGHHGMIFVPSSVGRTRADTGRLAGALEAVLGAHPAGQLANGERWL